MARKFASVMAFLFFVCLHAHAAPSSAPLMPDEQDAIAARALDQLLGNPQIVYSSRIQDEAFLSGVVDRYLDTLDPSRLVFTAEDEAKFKRDPRWVRAALQGRALAAPLRIFEIYRTRFDAAMVVSLRQLERPLVLHQDAFWQSDRSMVPRAGDDKAWERMWVQAVQNDRMELLSSGRTEQQVDEDLEKRYRQSNAFVKEMGKDRILDLFLDAYARSFDPHSNYFPPAQAEDFATALSLSMEGIGVVLSREDTGVVIKEVNKAGPAHAAGLRPGDRLSAFGPSSDKMKPVEGLGLSDIVRDIRGPKGTSVVLEVEKKEGGALQRLSIVRAAIQIDDQKVKWKMATGASGNRVAIVSLPIFYHDFSAKQGQGNSATADVARALSQAAQAGAEGVVLDLTGNGGGSLVEAVNLVGLFVPPSPVVQVRHPSGLVQAIVSETRVPAWEGPMAVLVDGSSASASEIVAAALQDLTRAIIVGERTYGKGTVQTLIDLDHAAARPDRQLGQVKLTTAQFFRPSGESTQLVGVSPDIVLGTSKANYGERSYANALPSASIDPAVKVPSPGEDRFQRLRQASQGRLVALEQPMPPTRLPLDATRRKALQQELKAKSEAARKKRQAWVQEAVNIVSDQIQGAPPS